MPNHLQQHQFSGGRRTTLALPSAVLRQFCCTINTWEGSTEETSCMGTTCRTKSRKFYRYIFYFLFDVAITNAHILQKSFCPDNVYKNVKEFRLQLARELMGDYSSRCRAGRRPSQITTLPLRHFPIRIPHESHSKNFKGGRCAHCKMSHCRKDTTWFCRECEMWLCHNGDMHGDCFLQWHKGREL